MLIVSRQQLLLINDHEANAEIENCLQRSSIISSHLCCLCTNSYLKNSNQFMIQSPLRLTLNVT